MSVRWLFTLSAPLALVAIGWTSQPFLEPLTGTLLQIRQQAPYAVTLLAMVLAASFNQSRLFFSLLAYGLFTALLAGDVARYIALVPRATQTTAELVSLLMPLNLLVFARAQERGFFTLRGGGHLGFVLLQVVAVAYLTRAPSPSLIGWVGKDYLNLPEYPFPAIPQLGLMTMAAAFFGIVTALAWRRTAANTGLLGVFAGTVTSLSCFPSASCMQTMLLAVGIGMIVLLIGAGHWLAYRDELTGLPARRALKEHLLKLGGRYSVAMADVDHFKRFNDRYGHDVGDQVLKMVAACLAKAGGGGKAFRYGGEEFTLVFSGKTAEEATTHLEAVREAIAASDFTVRGRDRPRRKPKQSTPKKKRIPQQPKKVRVTISMGVADSSKMHRLPDDVIKVADKALYRAKRGGRNRVSQ